MNPDTVLDIATAPKSTSLHWEQGVVTWGEICAWVDDPAGRKESGGYVLGHLRPTTVDHAKQKMTECTALHRRKAAVVTRSALVLDADHARPDLPAVVEMLLGCAAVLHTTYSSSPDDLRLRIIIPTDRLMAPDEYHAAVHALMTQLGEDQFDRTSAEPERFMFRPAAQERSWYQSWVQTGPPLAVDDLLADFEPDLSTRPAPRNRKRDPFDIGGPIGAFNRAYADLDTLIEAYGLPYEPAGADRWHLVGARSVAGMGPVQGAQGLFYSHHANDPAHGVTCSSFDLARLHLYGDLDENADPSTPVNRLPSHVAMLERATRDPRVVAEVVGVDFAEEMEKEADQQDWRLKLRLSPKTGFMTDVIGNWDLLKANDPVFRGLYFNEFSMAVESDSDLPWRPLARGGVVFSSVDRAALCHYIEREYGVRPMRSLVDELIGTAAQQRFVNPVRDYLDTLVWDGTPRVETCLPGVRPTPYTRMVARKSLVAAVARIYQPGVKWDHTLVLYGDEGLGKSYWIDRMSRGYSASLGRIGDKDTLITMQRTWIMVADEGYSLRKADADVQKEFLTRTEDVFRMPYEREALVHPRHCVIWSTTNDEVFLRRQEGNRRFLIVHCEDKVDFTQLDDEYIAQLWAEAVHLYRAGEVLFLADTESATAAEERERFTEEDALSGVVQEYLDTLVPGDWEEMSPDARQLWMMNKTDGFTPEGGVQIMRVCSAQVWVEALGRRFGEHRRTDLLEINTVLKNLPGWQAVPGRVRLPGYGPQLVFIRDEGGLI